MTHVRLVDTTHRLCPGQHCQCRGLSRGPQAQVPLCILEPHLRKVVQGHERLFKGKGDAGMQHGQVLVHQALGVGALIGDARTPHGGLAQQPLTAVLCVCAWVNVDNSVHARA